MGLRRRQRRDYETFSDDFRSFKDEDTGFSKEEERFLNQMDANRAQEPAPVAPTLEGKKQEDLTGQEALGKAVAEHGLKTASTSPLAGAGLTGGAALLTGATPAGAGVLAGSALVGGLMKQRADREAQNIANEMTRRKRVADVIQKGTTGQSVALQNAINNMSKALLF